MAFYCAAVPTAIVSNRYLKNHPTRRKKNFFAPGAQMIQQNADLQEARSKNSQQKCVHNDIDKIKTDRCRNYRLADNGQNMLTNKFVVAEGSYLVVVESIKTSNFNNSH